MIAENIKNHKILNTKKTNEKYESLTENRNSEEVKYHYIKTVLRSQENYNKIPYIIRIKSISNFKLSYKKYRNEKNTNPKL